MVLHGYATGDPWRWSPVTVEMLLADWFPRKVIAEPAYLAKLPDLVRSLHPLLPRPQRHPRRPDRGDSRGGRPVGAGVPAADPLDRQQAMAGLAEAVLESERLEGLSDSEWTLEYIAGTSAAWTP